MQRKRYQALDILRAFSILYVVFIHGAIYNYAKLNELDIARLPVYLIAIGAVGLWGGIFVMYALIVNVISLLRSSSGGRVTLRTLCYLVGAGLIYVFLVGTIQTLFLGRWSIDSSSLQLTVVAEMLRGQDISLHVSKLLDGSGIKMIGLNLVLIPLALYALFRRRGMRDEPGNYMLLVCLGLIILFFSFTRLYLYGDWIEALASGNWLGGFIGALMVADPYPGITYLAYGFFGAAIGLMLWYKRASYLRRYMLPLGASLVALGVTGMTMFQPQFFGPSWFWFAKVVAETGVFIFLVSGAALIDVNVRHSLSVGSRSWLPRLHKLFEPASRICLTIYLLETTTSELMRHVWFMLVPSWNTSLIICLVLGFSNMLLWFGLAHFWQRWNFRYSIEYFWVKLFVRLGKNSTKLST